MHSMDIDVDRHKQILRSSTECVFPRASPPQTHATSASDAKLRLKFEPTRRSFPPKKAFLLCGIRLLTSLLCVPISVLPHPDDILSLCHESFRHCLRLLTELLSTTLPTNPTLSSAARLHCNPQTTQQSSDYTAILSTSRQRPA